MHFTCDQCGKEMRPDGDPRYAITIDVRAAHDVNELIEDDLDDDHMEALSLMLRDLEDGEETAASASADGNNSASIFAPIAMRDSCAIRWERINRKNSRLARTERFGKLLKLATSVGKPIDEDVAKGWSNPYLSGRKPSHLAEQLVSSTTT